MSFCHFLNDMVQSLLPAIYPLLKTTFHLDFGQVGLITFTYQLTASLLQPAVGFYTDRRPMPYSLAAGMSFTLVGLMMLSAASSFPALLFSSALVGMGSAVPPRVVARGAHGLGRPARLGAVAVPGGRQRGFVDGSAAGGVYRAPAGQRSIAWFSSWR